MRKILIVEDDAKMRSHLRELLGDGYAYAEADTLAAAGPLLDDPGLGFILLDLRLPNGHGRELLRELVARRNDVPVVVITGFKDEEAPPREWPVTSILEKPVSGRQLVEAVAGAERAAAAISSIRRSTARLRDRI